MTTLSADLIAHITERAPDPKRCYRLAAEDEWAVSLPTSSIAQEFAVGSTEAGDVVRQPQARMASMGFAMPLVCGSGRSAIYHPFRRND